MSKFLIVTADDFGLHEAVNAAVQQASDAGVLTCASLMVGAPAAADAIRRARDLPALRVGLHLVLADGWPVLSRDRIPDLLDAAGRFGDRMAVDGVRFFALPSVRRQLEAEIRAQFGAFARSGLALDHVNAHKHFHLHPTVLETVIRVSREYGLPPVRLPLEPLAYLRARHAGLTALGGAALLRPWLALMKQRLRGARIAHNDQLFGIADSGAMDEGRLLDILSRLPGGVSEIYLHPATESGAAIAPSMPHYRHVAELEALLSSRVRAAVASAGVTCGGFRDLCRTARPPQRA